MEIKIKTKDLIKTKGQNCPFGCVEDVKLNENNKLRIASSVNEVRKLINQDLEKVEGGQYGNNTI